MIEYKNSLGHVTMAIDGSEPVKYTLNHDETEVVMRRIREDATRVLESTGTEWARVSRDGIVTLIDVKKCFEGPENQYTALAKAVWNEAIEAVIEVCRTTGIKHPQQTGQEACEVAIRELKK